ncbi:MAG TPA: nucleoside deaminase [Candidatus Woesearchaeota archaeon]|nr:nucleoside deaminase [Candidatus Woesearchaeota archaeon]
MLTAVEEARKGASKCEGGPFGAVIVKHGKIVAKAHNLVLKKNDPTCHAEIEAIRKASKKLGTYNLEGCEIYSTTEPCPMCFSAIHWARIGKIYFGTETKDAAEIGFNELAISDKTLKRLGNSKIELVPGYKREECLKLLEYWKNMNCELY